MTCAYYRPVSGRRIRHRDGQLMPPEGETIRLTPYFARLLRDGDIEPVVEPVVRTSEKPARIRSRRKPA